MKSDRENIPEDPDRKAKIDAITLINADLNRAILAGDVGKIESLLADLGAFSKELILDQLGLSYEAIAATCQEKIANIQHETDPPTDTPDKDLMNIEKRAEHAMRDIRTVNLALKNYFDRPDVKERNARNKQLAESTESPTPEQVQSFVESNDKELDEAIRIAAIVLASPINAEAIEKQEEQLRLSGAEQEAIKLEDDFNKEIEKFSENIKELAEGFRNRREVVEKPEIRAEMGEEKAVKVVESCKATEDALEQEMGKREAMIAARKASKLARNIKNHTLHTETNSPSPPSPSPTPGKSNLLTKGVSKG